MREEIIRRLGLASLTLSFQYLILRELRLNHWHNLRDHTDKKKGGNNNYNKWQPKPVVLEPTGQSGRYSRLPNVDKYMRIYYNFSFYYYVYLVLKYSMLCVLRQEHLRKEYGYIGCYMVGRLFVNGRVTGLSNYFVLFAATCLFIWRLAMVQFKPSHRLYCYEFLMYETEELSDYAADLQEARHAKQNHHSYQSILQLKSILTTREQRDQEQVAPLRLNRTAHSWRLMTQSFATHWLSSFVILVLVVPLFFLMALPVAFTKRGFGLAYDECSAWISHQVEPHKYSHIHQVSHLIDPIKGRLFLPWDELVDFNAYQCARVVVEGIENFMLYFDSVTFFVSNTGNSLLISADICNYARELSSSLRQLNADMREAPKNRWLEEYRHTEQVDILEQKIQAMQSMLVDYFNLVDAYGQFASRLALWSLVSWITLAAMIFGGFMGPDNQRPKLEWYLLHLYRTYYAIMDLGSFARLRVASRRIYPLMATCACLHQARGRTKRRWKALMSYYCPRPLYCFRLFKSVEVSWLFLLKLFTWLLSSLVIASTFLANAGHDI